MTSAVLEKRPLATWSETNFSNSGLKAMFTSAKYEVAWRCQRSWRVAADPQVLRGK
jgi:hypothetical protein